MGLSEYLFAPTAAAYREVAHALAALHPELRSSHWTLALRLVDLLPPSPRMILSRLHISRIVLPRLLLAGIPEPEARKVVWALYYITSRWPEYAVSRGIQAMVAAGYLRFLPSGEAVAEAKLWEADGSDLPSWVSPRALDHVRAVMRAKEVRRRG